MQRNTEETLDRAAKLPRLHVELQSEIPDKRR
jgi:hypothetical protein